MKCRSDSLTHTKNLTMFCTRYVLDTCHTIFKMMDTREPWTILEAKLGGLFSMTYIMMTLICSP